MCTLLIQRFGGSILGRTKLSPEVLAELRKNPHVASIFNGYQVEFTPEFKEMACQELLKGDKSMREILQEHGINPELLGDKRIWTLTHNLRKVAKAGKGFMREYSHNSGRKPKDQKRFDAIDEDKKLSAVNVPNVYNVSQKEREAATNGMDAKSSDYEERIESLKQTQALDIEVFEAEVEANNTSETNHETGTLQKAFTEEERSVLLTNPYVASVTNDAVQFTEEFKELAYEEFLQTKKTMREILQEHGIDPEILGSKRIWNFTSKLQEKAKKLQGFGDARTHNRRRPKCSPNEEKTLTERIRGLEHELAYTRQEVEFLKKTQMADMEARISWESKHRKK